MSAAQRSTAAGSADPDGPNAAGGRGDTRERLIGAASRLLADGGPDAVTMRKVGELAGVSRAAPYRHFDDKSDLLGAAALSSLEPALAEIHAALPTAATPPAAVPEALRRAFMAYLRYGMDHPKHYRLAFGEHLSFVDGSGVYEAASRTMGCAVDALAQGQRTGAVRAGEPRAMALLAWSALHGLVTLAMSGHLEGKGLEGGGNAESGAFAGDLVADLVAGLTAREQPAGPARQGATGGSGAEKA
ncbi:TetR/AcrR family transcriptional regulator [Streptomonospora sediminis]